MVNDVRQPHLLVSSHGWYDFLCVVFYFCLDMLNSNAKSYSRTSLYCTL